MGKSRYYLINKFNEPLQKKSISTREEADFICKIAAEQNPDLNWKVYEDTSNYGGKRKGAGRKKLNENEVKSCSLCLQVTQDERSRIKNLAKQLDLTMSEFLREMLSRNFNLNFLKR